MQGYLELWQGYISRWSKYYFRIHEELLIYGPNPQQIQGRVHLKVSQIITKLDDPVSLIINTGTETLYLKAYSIDEKVKWYKKLKETQKMVQELSQNKQLFKMKMELSKINRFKILDDLNTELWKCHAELEQRLEEVILKTKNVMLTKNIDKLRMSIDQFKYKTSQILQYIDQEIRQLKLKQQDKELSRPKAKPSELYSIKKNNEQLIQRQDDTRYYSFYQTNHEQELSPHKLQRIEEFQKSSVSSLSLNLKPNKSSKNEYFRSCFRKDEQKVFEQEKNPIKFRLFHSNKVYNLLGNIFQKSQTRRTLPQRHLLQENFPIFKTISGALASDITKASFPISLNQPLSMLQKGCEQMYYCSLLKKGDQSNDQNMRMLNVAAFIVSSYSLNQNRTNRPFNALLGQTFEYIDQSRGFEFLSEQVSLQPPVSAYYIKSNNYEIFDNSKLTSHFTGNTIKMKSDSKTIIKLQKLQDFYVFNKCTLSLSNLIAGKLAIQIFGQLTIKCKEFNTTLTLNFAEDSIWKKYSYEVKGCLENNGKKLYSLHGEWNKDLICQNLQTKQKILLWSKTHPIFYQYYNFNDLSLQLNHLSLYNCKNLPPSDSRFRPDVRALQHRVMQLAAQERCRLQEKQRGRMRQNEKNNSVNRIVWFKQTIIRGEDVYTSNEKYWGQKIKGSWKNSSDLF